MMNEAIREVTTTLCPDSMRQLGVGVGTGSLIDFRKGRIRYSMPLGVKFPVDFKKTVSAGRSCPRHVENEANCCTWGELSFNHDEALRDFIFALVEFRHDSQSVGRDGGLGVSLGITLNGKVYCGAHGNAEEFRSAFCEGPGELPLSLPKSELVRLDPDRGILLAAIDELAQNMAMPVNGSRGST